MTERNTVTPDSGGHNNLARTSFATDAVHGGRELGVGDAPGGSVTLSTNFVLPRHGDGIFDYARVENPNSA